MSSTADFLVNLRLHLIDLSRRLEQDSSDDKLHKKESRTGPWRAVVKFHYRRVDRLKNKYRKIEQAQSRRSYQETNQSSRKAPARNRNTSEDKNKNELAEVLKAKNREVDTLLEQMRAQANNKKSETDNKAVKSRKRTERRKSAF